MKKNVIEYAEAYIKEHISEFHESKIEKLKNMKLDTVLKRKNPYMFKAKSLDNADGLVKGLMDAVCSSSEETLFGDWIERLAIYIAGEMFGGRKSTTKGVDLEMDKDNIHYIISIKSGPNWSNSSSMDSQKKKFKEAQRVYRTGGNTKECKAIIGCCYGKTYSPYDDPMKMCGQSFWEFISGSPTLYLDIIEPLGTDAKAKNEAYQKAFNQLKNKLSNEFMTKYCRKDGSIDWEKFVRFNSEKRPDVNKSSVHNSNRGGTRKGRKTAKA